jgi:hypothetical protein
MIPSRLRSAGIACLTAAGVLLGACGIEDYPFLQPVPSDNVTQVLNERATVRLPAVDSNDTYFRHYALFYRIYISGLLSAGQIAEATLPDINATLKSDDDAIKPYTQTDNNLATGVGSLFSNRKFYQIGLEDSNIETVMSNRNSATVTLDFQISGTNQYPRLTINQQNSVFNFIRSNGNGLFNPEPADRHFINTGDLNSSANISTTVNADVCDNTSLSGGKRYTYAAVYIAAVGFDSRTLSPIYSSPTFVNVFLLPD